MSDIALGMLVTYNPATVQADSTLEEVMQLLNRDQVRHVPVVDRDHSVVGILSGIDALGTPTTIGNGSSNGSSNKPWNTSVGERMNTPVVTVEHGDAPLEALKVLLAKNIHSVPVVEEGRLIGMISSSDYLRELTYGQWPSHSDVVSKHMQSDESQIEFDAAATEALELMEHLQLKYLAVVNGGCPVGILSRRDVQIAAAANSAPLTVKECFKADIPTVRPSYSLSQSTAHMLEHQSPAVAVADRTHRMVGLLTQDDVLRAILQEMDA